MHWYPGAPSECWPKTGASSRSMAAHRSPHDGSECHRTSDRQSSADCDREPAARITGTGIGLNVSGLLASGARARARGMVSLTGSTITSTAKASADSDPSSGRVPCPAGCCQLSGSTSRHPPSAAMDSRFRMRVRKRSCRTRPFLGERDAVRLRRLSHGGGRPSPTAACSRQTTTLSSCKTQVRPSL